MLNTAQAIELLHELVVSEVELVKALNNGRTTQRVERRERKAVAAVFEKLTGTRPTDGEVSLITSV